MSQAFDLNMKVTKRANDERVLHNEYLKLSERCKTFVIDLYNGCRSMKEIMALLGINEEHLNFSRGRGLKKECRASVVEKLRRAIECDHKELGEWRWVEG